MADLGAEDKEMLQLDLEVRIDRSRAKTKEFKMNAIGFRKKADEAEANIPIQEQHTIQLEQELQKLK